MTESPDRVPKGLDRRSMTEDELSWYAADPRTARAWASRSRIMAWVLLWAFVIGLLAHLLGWAIGNGGIGVPVLPADLTAELLSNLGLILWTSAVVVFFLEVVPVRIQRRAERYTEAAEATLRERGVSLPPREPDEDDAIGAKLDLIAERLDALERKG